MKIVFVVVANAEMYRDATNLFRVKFTLTMDYDFTKAFEMFDNWYKSVDEKLRSDRISDTYQELEVSTIYFCLMIELEFKEKKQTFFRHCNLHLDSVSSTWNKPKLKSYKQIRFVVVIFVIHSVN